MQVDAFLADAVESAEGKLFALGVGWNALAVPGFPATHPRISIGIVVHVEAAEAGEHRLTLAFCGPDDEPRPFGTGPDGTDQRELIAGFSAGPAPGHPEANVAMALNLDGLTFTAPGDHTFVIGVDGIERRRLRFRVDQVGGAGDQGSHGGAEPTSAPSKREPGSGAYL